MIEPDFSNDSIRESLILAPFPLELIDAVGVADFGDRAFALA
jgi:hypothetical protein